MSSWIEKTGRLGAVKTGKQVLPMRILAMGLEGVGKSTFAAGAPSPIFVGADAGTGELDVARYEPKDFDDILGFVADLENEEHAYKTLVLDTINWIEPMVFARVAGPGGDIEKYGGGFGKGYTAAVDHWRTLVGALERVWTVKRMNVIMLAHTHVKAFNDPEGSSYDRYEVAMNVKAAAVLKQWSDYVLFLRREAFSRVDEKTKKEKGFSTGKRVIHSEWTAAYDAKSRVRLPDPMPLSWSDFSTAVENGRSNGDDVKAEIARLLGVIGDEGVTTKATAKIAAAGADIGKLNAIANALAIKAHETEEKMK